MTQSAKNTRHRVLELLAPARNAEIAIAAIDHGADAVYIGPPHHGARHAAGNSLDDIARVVDYAHRFNARVYVTLNTLVYDNETDEVQRLVYDLYRTGADALIVQDMSLLEMNLPPIALHASTQCDIRTPQRARFLQDAGFTQLVLARELTLDEIREVRRETSVPLEAFVHGALCVSYSGNCQASMVVTGRSANRGECAQMCRLPYDLIDGKGNTIIAGKHLLSLRDMNRLDSLEEMIDAGIDSFKIEGRLKDIDYVKNVVSTYSKRLDEIIARNTDGTLSRRSFGRVTRTFDADLAQTFNRGYTDYFLHKRKPLAPMASIDTPKSAGAPIGKVRRVNQRTVTVSTSVQLSNGDGFTYYDENGKLQGFRANRADGNTLYLTSAVNLRPGTMLYRNRNTRREAIMASTTARRIIDLDMTLRTAGSSLVLDVTVTGHPKLTATASLPIEGEPVEARTNQSKVRHDTLAKLGDTNYSLSTLDDRVPPMQFIPVSVIANLRRLAIAALDNALRASYRREMRGKMNLPQLTGRKDLDYTDNVANRLAAKFYTDAGAETIQPAIECARPAGPVRVMLTRYCLRRELGYCLKTPQGKTLAAPLKLRGAGFELRLDFDCRNCEMSVYTY